MLVNVELAWEGSFRLTFRAVDRKPHPMTDSKRFRQAVIDDSFKEIEGNKGGEGNAISPSTSSTDLYWHYFLEKDDDKEAIDDLKGNPLLAMREFSVEINNKGIRQVDDFKIHPVRLNNEFLFKIIPLSEKDSKEWLQVYKTQMMPSVNVGDFLWLWKTSSTLIEGEVKTEELLVKCVFSLAPSFYLFDVYPTNRQEQMKKTMLQKATDMLVLSIPPEGTEELKGTIGEEEIRIHTIIHIPKEKMVQFILNYLLFKEKVLNNLSTCFFYHAAVSIPHALIYAAEILCVAIGSKPVALVSRFSSLLSS